MMLVEIGIRLQNFIPVKGVSARLLPGKSAFKKENCIRIIFFCSMPI